MVDLDKAGTRTEAGFCEDPAREAQVAHAKTGPTAGFAARHAQPGRQSLRNCEAGAQLAAVRLALPVRFVRAHAVFHDRQGVGIIDTAPNSWYQVHSIYTSFMNNELVLRLIALVQKSGDRLVLADSSTGEGVVVMDLADYERLLHVTDETERSTALQGGRHRGDANMAKIEHARGVIPDDDNLFESVTVNEPEQPTAMAEELAAASIEVSAPQAFPKPVGPQGRKKAPVKLSSAVGPNGRRQTSSFESGPATAALSDLTQAELMDKINRDIGEWKAAHTQRQTTEQRFGSDGAAAALQPGSLDEEEKFYLEPIE
jgi:hypothetical protein